MVLDDDRINWPHAMYWGVSAWASAWLVAWVDARVPVTMAPLVMISPLLMVFAAGVYERESWWVRASLLSLAPFAALLVYTVLHSLATGNELGGDAMGLGILILLVAGPLALALGALAVLFSAALGVHVGQRAAGGRA
ncbi:MAG: hypothetical protein QM692_21325 [Thermomicrobiales bacterium]